MADKPTVNTPPSVRFPWNDITTMASDSASPRPRIEPGFAALMSACAPDLVECRIVKTDPPRIFPNPSLKYSACDRLLSLPQSTLLRIYSYLLPARRPLRLLLANELPFPGERRVDTALFRLSWFTRISAQHFLLRNNTIVIKPNVHNFASVFPSPNDFSDWLANIYNGKSLVRNLRLPNFADYIDGEGRQLRALHGLLAQCPGIKRLEIDLQAFIFLERRGPNEFWRRDQRKIFEDYELRRIFSLGQLMQLVVVVWVPPAFCQVPRQNLEMVCRVFATAFQNGFREMGMKTMVDVFAREDTIVSVRDIGKMAFTHQWM